MIGQSRSPAVDVSVDVTTSAHRECVQESVRMRAVARCDSAWDWLEGDKDPGLCVALSLSCSALVCAHACVCVAGLINHETCDFNDEINKL